MDSLKTFLTERVSISGLGGSLGSARQELSPSVPIHEYARDQKGRYDRDILLKLLSRRSNLSDEEIDFIFEYLMVGDQFGGWAQHQDEDDADPFQKAAE